ncbi:hypothetical protein M0805_001882, partial [Coniferiporia weirii]
DEEAPVTQLRTRFTKAGPQHQTESTPSSTRARPRANVIATDDGGGKRPRRDDVRVITTSSSTHLTHGPGIKWETLKAPSASRTKYGTMRLYAQSKYGNVVVARELARRYGDQGIISISLNPGNLNTELQRHASGLQVRIVNLVTYPAPLGALTQLWAGTMPEAVEYNGKYLFPWARLGEPRKDTQDPDMGVKLWEWLEEQVKDV